MKSDDFELDFERRLWKPNRRSFFFGLGAALIAPMLPNLPEPALKAATGWGDSTLRIGDTFTIKGVYSVNPVSYSNIDLETFRITSCEAGIYKIESTGHVQTRKATFHA